MARADDENRVTEICHCERVKRARQSSAMSCASLYLYESLRIAVSSSLRRGVSDTAIHNITAYVFGLLRCTRNDALYKSLKLFLISLLCFLLPINLYAAPVVADLSNYRIAMDSGFNGTRLFLFGTRNDNGDIVVVIRGTERNYIVRKKEKIAGIWINRDRVKFYNIPDFYAAYGSKPLSEIERNSLFKTLGIGEENLFPSPGSHAKESQFHEFEAAFLDYQHKKRLYNTATENIGFMGETLFKTAIEFSDNIPPGRYTAEIYLIGDGEIIGQQSTPIEVEKIGLDAFIYNSAHNSPALYGLAAVAIALFMGWTAGRLFEAKS